MNPKPLTLQEAFNQVWDWFVVQGNPQSTTDHGEPICQYRGPNGAKCAAGVLLTDEEYKPSMEGSSFQANEWGLHRFRHIEVEVGRMQCMHDQWQPLMCVNFNTYMKEKLTGFAIQYSLTVPGAP